MKRLSLVLAICAIAVLSAYAKPAKPVKAKAAAPFSVIITLYPAINSYQLGNFTYWQDNPYNPSDSSSRFGPGSLIAAQVSIFDHGAGGYVANGKLTSDTTDYSAGTWPQTASDGFYIRASNCAGPNMYIHSIKPVYFPNGSVDNTTKLITFYWPGNYTPEYGAYCSGLVSYGNVDFTFYKGSGATAGLNASYVHTTQAAPAYPITYITDVADNGRYIVDGYHVNSVTGAWTPMTTCNAGPPNCPIYTTVGGVPQYHTIVIYTMGLGDAIGSSLSHHSKLKFKAVSGPALVTPTRTYFGAVNFLAEQHNFSTQGLAAGKHYLQWTCSTFIGCTPLGAVNFWQSDVGLIRVSDGI